MWHVYVLESKMDDNRYVGMTNDLKHRFDMHNAGKVFATKGRRPFKMIYVETYINRYDAAARERFLKTDWGKNYLSRALENYLLQKS